MKKTLLAMCVLFMFAGNALAADGNRVGAQFESGGNLGLIYYGEDFGWAAGGGVGFSDLDMNDRTGGYHENSDEVSVNFFVRKNFKIHTKTYLGLGVTTSLSWGDAEHDYDTAVETVTLKTKRDTNSWSVAPYFIIDHHLNEHFIINAGATIVKFKETRVTGADTIAMAGVGELSNSDTYGKSNTEEYFNPFFGLTYLF